MRYRQMRMSVYSIFAAMDMSTIVFILAVCLLLCLFMIVKRSRKSPSRERQEAYSDRTSTEPLDLDKNREELESERAQKRLLIQNLIADRDENDLPRREKVYIATIRGQINEIELAIESSSDRKANTRSGYVYVVSNIGVFGPEVVKIGMTRRVNPLDRIEQLNSASVPFKFDLHLFHYSEDALETETALHKHFASRRVNLANARKEFFFATPAEVRDKVATLGGVIVEFNEKPEAIEFRKSEEIRSRQLARGKHRK